MSLADIFNAGRVRRWHTNPVMSQHDDYNDAHSGRVARIIADLHPNPSAELLKAALQHDDGEEWAGDVPYTAKIMMPLEMLEYLENVETNARIAKWGKCYVSDLSESDYSWLKFADRLDAYMWQKHKEEWQLSDDDWRPYADKIIEAAEALGVKDKIIGIVDQW
jgi:5'-deoxynucleotidase